jgi:hypothetical protein
VRVQEVEPVAAMNRVEKQLALTCRASTDLAARSSPNRTADAAPVGIALWLARTTPALDAQPADAHR